jgi:cobyrinic acid a,c-diamide synthase
MSSSLRTPGSGFVIASTQSSGGKTFINASILAALHRRGVPVQPFKTGPDYIDTGYASYYASAPCYNLDSWLMGDDNLHALAERKTQKAFGVLEGVMGLFDGKSPESDAGSTCDVARKLGWPVFLVIPATKHGRSIRAIVRGFCDEAGEGVIKGIILNKVSSTGHSDYLRKALEDLPVPVVGSVPIVDGVAWPERHLGLQSVTEAKLVDPYLLADTAEKWLDIDRMLELTQPIKPAPKIYEQKTDLFKGKKIAIARDEAFHFYYPDNLDYMQRCGATLVPFSPLYDVAIPSEADAVFLGGGFPEVFAEKLSQNDFLRKSFQDAHAKDFPIYAECGGLMYLCEHLQTKDGTKYPMMGLIPGSVVMTGCLNHFGYSRCQLLNHPEHEPIHAHEFHYSYWDAEETTANCWEVSKLNKNQVRKEGYREGRLIASYMHCYVNQALPLWEQLLG